MSALAIKICGLREPANLAAVAGLRPDFIGLVFHPASARYVGAGLGAAAVRARPAGVQAVGVFVDADLPTLLVATAHYGLDYAQLHGHETAAFCQAAQQAGLRVIKAFAVGEEFDFDALADYAPHCVAFLFDTKGPLPGGNGQPFDWRVLAGYHGSTPFFLSGGLGPENLAELRAFRHPQLAGLDFNSRLETAPGLKDLAATRQLLADLQGGVSSDLVEFSKT